MVSYDAGNSGGFITELPSIGERHVQPIPEENKLVVRPDDDSDQYS